MAEYSNRPGESSLIQNYMPWADTSREKSGELYLVEPRGSHHLCSTHGETRVTSESRVDRLSGFKQ